MSINVPEILNKAGIGPWQAKGGVWERRYKAGPRAAICIRDFGPGLIVYDGEGDGSQVGWIVFSEAGPVGLNMGPVIGLNMGPVIATGATAGASGMLLADNALATHLLGGSPIPKPDVSDALLSDDARAKFLWEIMSTPEAAMVLGPWSDPRPDSQLTRTAKVRDRPNLEPPGLKFVPRISVIASERISDPPDEWEFTTYYTEDDHEISREEQHQVAVFHNENLKRLWKPWTVQDMTRGIGGRIYADTVEEAMYLIDIDLKARGFLLVGGAAPKPLPLEGS